VLIAVSDIVSGVRRRPDLELFPESVRVEISLPDGCNLLIGNHYFAPDIKVDLINNYLNFLGNVLDTLNYRVFLLGDFNVPGFSWDKGMPAPHCHYYTKLKGEAIHSATCFLGLSQYNHSVGNSNLLDLVCSNIANISLHHVEYGLVQSDHFHPPFIIDVSMSHWRNNTTSDTRRVIIYCSIILCSLMIGHPSITYPLLIQPLTD
jgi:hypothetical protein